jgi:CRP-like cAMP-binding protein
MAAGTVHHTLCTIHHTLCTIHYTHTTWQERRAQNLRHCRKQEWEPQPEIFDEVVVSAKSGGCEWLSLPSIVCWPIMAKLADQWTQAHRLQQLGLDALFSKIGVDLYDALRAGEASPMDQRWRGVRGRKGLPYRAKAEGKEAKEAKDIGTPKEGKEVKEEGQGEAQGEAQGEKEKKEEAQGEGEKKEEVQGETEKKEEVQGEAQGEGEVKEEKKEEKKLAKHTPREAWRDPGHVLLREGDAPSQVWLLLEGELEIRFAVAGEGGFVEQQHQQQQQQVLQQQQQMSASGSSEIHGVSEEGNNMAGGAVTGHHDRQLVRVVKRQGWQEMEGDDDESIPSHGFEVPMCAAHQVLAVQCRGVLVGEVAVMLKVPQPATVVAKTRVRLLRLAATSKELFHDLDGLGSTERRLRAAARQRLQWLQSQKGSVTNSTVSMKEVAVVQFFGTADSGVECGEGLEDGEDGLEGGGDGPFDESGRSGADGFLESSMTGGTHTPDTSMTSDRSMQFEYSAATTAANTPFSGSKFPFTPAALSASNGNLTGTPLPAFGFSLPASARSSPHTLSSLYLSAPAAGMARSMSHQQLPTSSAGGAGPELGARSHMRRSRVGSARSSARSSGSTQRGQQFQSVPLMPVPSLVKQRQLHGRHTRTAHCTCAHCTQTAHTLTTYSHCLHTLDIHRILPSPHAFTASCLHRILPSPYLTPPYPGLHCCIPSTVFIHSPTPLPSSPLPLPPPSPPPPACRLPTVPRWQQGLDDPAGAASIGGDRGGERGGMPCRALQTTADSGGMRVGTGSFASHVLQKQRQEALQSMAEGGGQSMDGGGGGKQQTGARRQQGLLRKARKRIGGAAAKGVQEETRLKLLHMGFTPRANGGALLAARGGSGHAHTLSRQRAYLPRHDTIDINRPISR